MSGSHTLSILCCRALAGVALIGCLAGCGEPAPTPLFVDASDATGLNFVHFNGMSGELYFPEMMGAGAALFDADNDGDLDLYLVQGSMLGAGKALSEATLPTAYPEPLTDRLYRNDPDAKGNAHFVDITEQAGDLGSGYGMGVASGDIDNDGLTDLYITNFGANQLLKNLGNGRFEDITSRANAGDRRWSVSASFADFDGDGWLDLYVGNYVDFRLSNHKPCRSSTSARDYCSPLVYLPVPDLLLANNRDGSFRDISDSSGITREFGGTLGVIAADFDADAMTDIYVANDGVANQLWINRGDLRFDNTAALAGVGVNMDGSPEASMGVDAADFDADGDEDLFMTHLARESNTLYVNDGSGWFEDRTLNAGLSAPSLSFTGFGTAWVDVDNDSFLDVVVVNGAVTLIEAQAEAGEALPLRQRDQLFMYSDAGRYREVPAELAGPLGRADVSRGAAFGDIDNDGDIDVVVSNNGGRARVLLNATGQNRHWLGLKVLLSPGGRDAIGARASVDSAAGRLTRRVRTDGSYASSRDPRILFGLGDDSAPRDVDIVWPDGSRERFVAIEPDRYVTLVRGTGLVQP